MVADSSSTSYTVCASLRLSTPEPIVALPCGSRSTISTRWPIFASPAARLTVVVVLPTPPFWLAMQKILATGLLGEGQLDAEADEEDAGQLLEPAPDQWIGAQPLG